MALNPNKDLKLYYSISEVAQMFNIAESNLRYWQTEFPQLSPHVTAGGVRRYRKEDIEVIKLIHHLVREKGMTIAGARQQLTDHGDATARKVEALERLKAVRNELLAIKKELDGIVGV